MTVPAKLSDVNPEYPILVLDADSTNTADTCVEWQESGAIVRSLRGRKMLTVDGVFDEFAAALQFPYYFGENWAAFNECLEDMEWMPIQDGIVIVITDSDLVLSSHPADLATLIRSIERAAQTYAKPIESGEWWDRPAVAFHVVLVASNSTLGVTSQWTQAGAVVTPLSLSP